MHSLQSSLGFNLTRVERAMTVLLLRHLPGLSINADKTKHLYYVFGLFIFVILLTILSHLFEHSFILLTIKANNILI